MNDYGDFMSKFASLIPLAFLVACGSEAPAPTPPAAPPPAAGGDAGPPPAAAGGDDNIPEIGRGQGEMPSMEEIQNQRFEVGASDGVKISGTVVYSGEKTGSILLQVVTLKADPDRSLRENQQADKRYVNMLHSQTLNGPGNFELLVPKEIGPVSLVAFMDEANDGPTYSDPAGLADVEIKQAAVSSVQLSISDNADLGEFSPPGRR